MLNLFITLLITSSLYLIFKSFHAFNINTFQAVVFNYITCIIVGSVFSWDVDITPMFHDVSWMYLSVTMGLLFITTFHLMAWTTQKISVSVATVSSKMSMILPVLFSFFYLGVTGDGLLLYFLGLFLAILAIYWSTKREENTPLKHTFLGYAFIIFILTGLVDISVNLSNSLFKNIPYFSQLFPITVFMMAAILGSIYLIIRLIQRKESFKSSSIIAGITLGIPNYFSIYFLLETLSDFNGNGAFVFPILNIGIIVFTSLLAFFIFKERLSRINILGISCAIISILLISYKELKAFITL